MYCTLKTNFWQGLVVQELIGLLLLITWVGSISAADSSPCSNIVSEDGYHYDLTKLIEAGIQTAQGVVDIPIRYNYEFEICGSGFECGSIEEGGQCSSGNAGACQSWANPPFSKPEEEACLGTNVPTLILPMTEGKGVSFMYRGGDLSRSTTVDIYCDPTIEGFNDVIFDDHLQHQFLFYIQIVTKEACPLAKAKLSPGSFFCIALVAMIVVYLIGGILINKLRKRTTGVQLIPNYEFWRGFPSLVKDGAVFLVYKIANKQQNYNQRL